MATGFVLNIPNEMLRRLDEADRKIKQLETTSEKVADSVVQSFSRMQTAGIGEFTKALGVLNKAIQQLEGTNFQGAGLSNLVSQLANSVDSINQFSAVFNNLIAQMQEGANIKPLQLMVVDGDIARLQQVQTKYREVRDTITSPTEAPTSKLADDVNKVAEVVDRIIVNGRAYTNSQLAKLNAEVEAEVVKLEKLQGQLQQYTTGKTGQQKYLPDWDIAGQYEEAAAASLEWLELLEEERKQVAATAAARIESAEAAKQADQERYQAWLKETYSKEQADRQDARDREAAADAKRYQDWLKQKDKEAQQAEALEDKKWAAMRQSVAKGHQAAQALEEKRYQKWLEQKHKEVQESKRLENAKWAATEQAIRAQNSTYKGALDLSQSAKSINQRIEAVKYLKIARESLSETDARYTQKVQVLNKALSNQQLAIDRLREKSVILKNSHSNLLDISGQLARRLALVFSVSQMTGYFNKLVQVRGELELQQKALQAILQNKRQADELWEKTVQLAVRSPYQIKDLVTYTKQLAAYRVETEKLHDTTKMLADVSSGLGVDMQRLILAYGQVKAANYLRGTELRQFSEAGINILGELATYFSEIESKGVSVAEVFDRVSKRMVTFADVEEIFKRITSAGGIFYKMQETQAETLKGQISNLKDAITVMLNEIGQANEGTLKFGVSLTRSMIENWRAIPPILTAVVSGLTMAKVASLSARESILRSALSLNVISDWGTEQLSLQQLLEVGLRKVTGSFKNFASFFTASGPAAIIVAAITAIAAGIADIVKYRIELRGITKEFEQMRKPVTDLAASMTVASWTGDIKKATTALAQLTKLAQEQYFIEVGFTAADLNSMDLAEIESTFAELQHRVFSASRFAEEFAKEMARTQQLQQWEFWSQGLTTALTDVGRTGAVGGNTFMKDLEQYGETANKVFGTLQKNISEIATVVGQADLTEYGVELLKTLTSVKAIDQTEGEYLESLLKAYEELLPVLDEYGYKNKTLDRQFRRLGRQAKEVEREFSNFAEGLDLNAAWTDEEKTAYIQFAIDTYASDKNYNAYQKHLLYQLANSKFEIAITPKIGSATQDSFVPEWVTRTRDAVKAINTKVEKELSNLQLPTNELFPVPDDDSTTDAWVSAVKKFLETIETEYGEHQTIVTPLMVEAYQILKKYADEIRGVANLTEKKTKTQAREKVLRRRIDLLKEVRQKYLELTESYGSDEARKKIMDAYGDTFSEAFAGTGIDLALYKIMTQTVTAAGDIGAEAGAALTEEMLAKLKELEESGTYIRSFDDSLVAFIKKQEGFRAKAYQDAGGVWTQGYGETQGVQQGKEWTQEFAEQRLRTRLTDDYAAAVNKVLDANRDLIITQEQYNALVDLAYQGGGGAVRSVIARAKDINEGVRFIQNIAAKIKATIGAKAAERFGESFVQSFKEAETIQERIAKLLEVSNLLVRGGSISKEWYRGMQKRSDERAKIFSGDLDIAEQLETVLVRIAGMDFTTTEGMIQALNKLKSLAAQEGPEMQKVLSQAISEFEAEIGLKVKKDAIEQLRTDIQNSFDEYKLSIELSKLNIDPNVAKALFGLETLTVDQLRNRMIELVSNGSSIVKTELEKGLANANWELIGSIIGRDEVKEAKKALEQISDLTDKEQMERVKKYLAYTRNAIGERAKIKIEELTQLKEIEESFTAREGASADEIRTVETAKAKAREGVRRETLKKLEQFNWEEFQKTETFLNIMGDLEGASEAALDAMITQLQNYKHEWQNLPLENVKQIVDWLEKLRVARVEAADPFKMAKTLRADIAADGRSYAAAEADLINAEQALAIDKTKLSMIEEINQARAEGMSREEQTAYFGEEYLKYVELTEPQLVALNSIIGKRVKDNKALVTSSSRQISNIKLLNKLYEKQGKYYSDILKMVSDLYGAFEEVYDIVGGDQDSVGKAIADMGMSIFSAIMSTLKLQKQLKDASDGARAFGKAMNEAMGVVGWIVMAVQIIASILSAIFKAHDKGLEQQIEGITAQVENLQKQYERLEQAIDDAFNTSQMRSYTEQLKSTANAQISYLRAMIALEEDKKSTDEDRIKEWEDEIESLGDSLADALQNAVSKATAGILDDAFSVARDFVDAWYDSFQEVGDGISGLEDNFQEMFLNLIKQQATLQIAGEFIDRWKKYLEAYVNEEDLILTTEEAKKWAAQVKEEIPDLSLMLENLFGVFGEGVTDLTEKSSLSGLQKGISSITEETAQILEAYLNSVRFYVADSNSKLAQLVATWANPEIENPMLTNLKIIAKQTTDIHTLLESLTAPHPTESGRGLKVII